MRENANVLCAVTGKIIQHPDQLAIYLDCTHRLFRERYRPFQYLTNSACWS